MGGIIDPAAGKVTRQRLDDREQEFPRVDDRIVSRSYRYGYSSVIGEVTPGHHRRRRLHRRRLLQRDLAPQPDRRHGPGTRVRARGHRGEAVFAPASPSAAEDDGYVMTFVRNPERGASDLVILAARDFHRPARGNRPPARPGPAGLPRQLDPRPIARRRQTRTRQPSR
jgi:carotenoid cleavage dioxygenase-like enzyme